jgi:hypothetical protein
MTALTRRAARSRVGAHGHPAPPLDTLAQGPVRSVYYATMVVFPLALAVYALWGAYGSSERLAELIAIRESHVACSLFFLLFFLFL